MGNSSIRRGTFANYYLLDLSLLSFRLPKPFLSFQGRYPGYLLLRIYFYERVPGLRYVKYIRSLYIPASLAYM